MEESEFRFAATCRWLLLFLPLLTSGCFDVKDELTLQADGSGSVRLETRTMLPAEMIGAMSTGSAMGGGGQGPVLYPPVSESEAKRFFPAKDFTVHVKQEKSGEGTVTSIDATFKDLNALLASPYGRAHALTVRIDGDQLKAKAITGMEVVARFAEMKDEGGMFGMGALGSLSDLQKHKEKMRAQFRLTLPNEIAAANGSRDAKTSTWTFERTKAKDATDFAQQLGTVLEASCPATGVKIAPDNPPRLALQRFADVQEGAFGAKGSGPDTNKILRAARFVPYAVQVTRSVDLSGEGGSHENHAQLMGAIVLPRDLVPQKWGNVKLHEAVDAKGNSLKPEDEDNVAGRVTRMERYVDSLGDDDGDDQPEGTTADAGEERRTVVMRFQSPEWQIKSIERVKGAIELHYYSGARIVKITNGIPAAWVRQIKNQSDAMQLGDFGGKERALSSPVLPELGLSLKFQMGMSMSEMTTLMLEAEGKQSSVTDVQVFDAEGKPWPTIAQTTAFDGEGSLQLMVAGQPQAPLSLALIVTGGGTTVQVPILVEKIPCK